MRLSSTFMVLAFAFAAIPARVDEAAAGDLKGHGGPIKAIVVSRDGGRALTASFDYSAIYWGLDSSEPYVLHRLIGHDAAVNAVAFSHDERLAVTASDDGTVGIWDLGAGALRHRFQGHTGKVVAVAVSPDGRWAASAAWDRTIRLWDLDAMTPGPVFSGHSGNVNAVVFAPGGDTIHSSGHDGTIRSWTIPGGEESTILRHGWGINTLRALPGGRLLFGALDGTVAVVDAATGETVHAFEAYEAPVVASAVSGDAAIVAAGGANGRISIWAADRWRTVHTHDNPYGPVWAIAFAADKRSLYYAGLDDFAINLSLDPVAAFEPAKGAYPRRFQVTEDMDLGERMFAGRCSVCHTLTPDDANRAGPTLYHLFGRKAGSVSGYAYSDALRRSRIIWSEETIDRLFTVGPQHYTPGTKMPLQSITDPQERAALIAFLKSNTDEPAASGPGSSKQ